MRISYISLFFGALWYSA